jgi:hypothetical protein
MKKRLWTAVVAVVWCLALVVTVVVAPTPANAEIQNVGWMVYTPNHPNGCAPLPFDCYVVFVYPD